ncbi:MAG TPA: DNA translocase FtsK 4TM domain-containing protein [Bryobacteraceae bacterium]|nr:DNA translocase FtsK 4TM domain-containing protein [Bryobacteraceae bacterium]
MRILGPTRFERLNEAAGLVFLIAGLFVTLSLVSYHPQDPSWNAVSGLTRAHNLTGLAGAHVSDLLLQLLGFGAFAIPVLLWLLAWKWMHSEEIESAAVKVFGAALLFLSLSTALSIGPVWRPWSGTFSAGGMLGLVLADALRASLNFAGSVLLTFVCLILSLYLVSTFSMSVVARWFRVPMNYFVILRVRWDEWREQRREAALERARQRAERRAAEIPEVEAESIPISEPVSQQFYEPEEAQSAPYEEIPIHEFEDHPPEEIPAPVAAERMEHFAPPEPLEPMEPAPAVQSRRVREPRLRAPEMAEHPEYRLPSTALLNEVPARNPYDSAELKEIAARIKSKFEEFNVRGSVVQINPGPVVTTFEFKPEAGIKYTRITTLSEDLCLGLQAESILIERIPGKPTVGIEVPNTRREVISLRQILESDEFQDSHSRLSICLGKDISGRIKVAALESMPHLLIAGSTGAGKSVMLNSMIMSILAKATPEEVRMILVDPKRLEMGLYEGIPHLLTPVITDAKKATNALRNAVLEMERRLKLLAAQGVRNIDQYNKKIRQLMNEPRSLFEDDEETEPDDLRPLPYILILIDELADLMMVERANVEECVTRLAQMARAVGMHLVLATQRPSVDVITGLIKANFPSRISFRVATRVDSRTVLDVMGAEHLLGKGDMLFLPPGSSRLIRVHGAFVTEAEINRVVDFWKSQARPDYDQSFLIAPPSEDEEGIEGAEFEAADDPAYTDAVRVVLEMGKASTSTLQRRLRLGYGRAARILDMMQHEGIIGPPDGSKPREVLKRPDWLEEVESQLR